MIKIFGVRPWAQVIGVVAIIAAFVGGWLAVRPPSPPEPCRDAVSLMCAGTTTCDFPDQRMKVTSAVAETCFLIECICPRRP